MFYRSPDAGDLRSDSEMTLKNQIKCKWKNSDLKTRARKRKAKKIKAEILETKRENKEKKIRS